jgi:hypothetical protein
MPKRQNSQKRQSGALTSAIRSHNQKAAATWGSGGIIYDKVSEAIADVLDRVVAATGTGWTQRCWPRAARRLPASISARA